MSPAEDDPLIRQLQPLQDLPPQYQRTLVQAGEIVHFYAGETLFRQHTQDEFVHFLLEGCVSLHKDGNYLRDIDAPSEVTRHPLDESGLRPFTVVARRACRVFRIEHRHLQRQRGLADTAPPAQPPEVAALDEADPADDWLIHILQRGIFRNLSAEAVQRILSRIEEFSLRAGDVVITQGDIGDYYYLIKEGSAEVRRRSSDALSVHLAELGPGSGFGEEALVAGTARNATVRMQTEGKLLRLSRDDFNTLLRPHVLQPLSLPVAEEAVANGARWLDVRYPEQYKHHSLKGAVNIPLPLLRLQLRQLDPQQTYITYGEQTGLAAVANFILCERGFDAFYLAEPMPLLEEPSLLLGDTQGSRRLAALVKDIEVEREKLEQPALSQTPPSELVSGSTFAPANRWRIRLEALLSDVETRPTPDAQAPRLTRLFSEIERSVEIYLHAQREAEHASLFAVLEEMIREAHAETQALSVDLAERFAYKETALAERYARLSELAKAIAQQKVAIQSARRQLEQKLADVEKAHRDALSLGALVSQQLGELETLVPAISRV